LPDISKINALAIGSVSKVDGLAKASILDIDGVAVPSALLLDTYTGAAAAYSVRLLRTAYTGDIMRVRRDSDNVEADVGFDSNNEFGLTSPVSNPSSGGPFTDFADFIGHGGTPANGFCRWWYDQSGNAVDAGQATSGSQPKIYDSSTGIIEEGGVATKKPAIQWDGVDDTMAASYGSLYSIPCTYSLVHTWPAYPGTYAAMMDGANLTYRHIYRLDNNGTTATAQAGTGILQFTDNLTDGQQYLSYIDFSGSAGSFVAIDGTVVTTLGATATSSIDGVTLGTTANFAFDCEFAMQEFIMWPSDQDGAGNRSGIETNIDTYFQIPGM
jgi:hypothetical protein